MRKILLAATVVFFLAACGDKSDSQLEKEAKEAVTKELSQKYKPGECDRWKIMEAGGAINKGSSTVVCDSNFKVDRGLVFSEVKIYRHNGRNAVCGIVSGYTDISKIGGRFVYTDGDAGHVFIKKSKEPAFLSDKSESVRIPMIPVSDSGDFDRASRAGYFLL